MERLFYGIASLFFILSVDSLDERICSPIHSTATEWYLDCSNRNLSALPKFADHPVVNLVLRNNSFDSSIALGDWKSLKYVDLSWNDLIDIENHTFAGIDELEKLNVSYCSLQRITSQHLRGRTLIKLLDLSGNPLLPRSKDFLAVVNGSLDRGTHSIHLSRMQLRDFEIPPDLFFNAKHLSYLDLSDNILVELPRFPPSLSVLDISDNFFTILKKGPFQNSTGLTYLIAHDNKELVEIDEDAFRHMENLFKISLAGNKKLEFIPNDVFFHNHNLRHVSLVGCNFKTLSPYLEPQFLRLQILELQGNPWKCDQSMRWLAGLNSTTKGLSHVRCADGTLFEEFFTVTKWNMWVILINLLVGMVFLFFVIGFWFVYDLEKRRKQANPYWRLGKGASTLTPVYVSTVV
ncbi:Leucine Rich Repeat [Nesidiocoris tenuis]|uniref:Leucine Rich Repeat n=1 Tax=Nesidiocoris tenuis TaxID=355587 RepID=A0ABN7ANI1_9HEMI|nr:Leucine Rich Repeat [Nesidiocoris tenuis]